MVLHTYILFRDFTTTISLGEMNAYDHLDFIFVEFVIYVGYDFKPSLWADVSGS